MARKIKRKLGTYCEACFRRFLAFRLFPLKGIKIHDRNPLVCKECREKNEKNIEVPIDRGLYDT